jgi:hypothetical protein
LRAQQSNLAPIELGLLRLRRRSAPRNDNQGLICQLLDHDTQPNLSTSDGNSYHRLQRHGNVPVVTKNGDLCNYNLALRSSPMLP